MLERFVGASQYPNHGQRVVLGQRLMQAASDIFLGWQRVRDIDGHTRDYYVRQLHDWKGAAEVETLRVQGATLYARVCGATSPALMPVPVTEWASHRTWASVTTSIVPSPTSHQHTRIKTSGTMSHSLRP